MGAAVRMGILTAGVRFLNETGLLHVMSLYLRDKDTRFLQYTIDQLVQIYYIQYCFLNDVIS